MTIQNLMIAAIQNLRKLMRFGNNRPVAMADNLSVYEDMDSVFASKMPFENIFSNLGERILTFIKSVVGKLQFQPT